MTPIRIQATEHQEQTAVLQWAAWNQANWPALALLFAIPNGARTAIRQARKLKAEGLKSGVPDLFLPAARWDGNQWLHGLFIEMKSRTGRASSQQNAWIEALRTAGYSAVICHSAEEAIVALIEYLSGDPTWPSCGQRTDTTPSSGPRSTARLQKSRPCARK